MNDDNSDEPAFPPKLAENIDQWMLGRGNIERKPGQPERLPPMWHYISIDLKGTTHRPAWIVVGPKSKITKELLEQEIEHKTGKKHEVASINNYGSTYKPRTRWLIANGFLTDLTGKVAARQQEREQYAKLPPNRKRGIPSPEAVMIWRNGRLQSVYKKRDEQEILPACWKRLWIDLHFVSEGKRTTVDWLVVEERPRPVKTYHDLILLDLQELLGIEKLVIRHMAVAGKQYIPAARALLKHGFYTDVPMEEIERRKTLDILERRRAF